MIISMLMFIKILQKKIHKKHMKWISNVNANENDILDITFMSQNA